MRQTEFRASKTSAILSGAKELALFPKENKPRMNTDFHGLIESTLLFLSVKIRVHPWLIFLRKWREILRCAQDDNA